MQSDLDFHQIALDRSYQRRIRSFFYLCLVPKHSWGCLLSLRNKWEKRVLRQGKWGARKEPYRSETVWAFESCRRMYRKSLTLRLLSILQRLYQLVEEPYSNLNRRWLQCGCGKISHLHATWVHQFQTNQWGSKSLRNSLFYSSSELSQAKWRRHNFQPGSLPSIYCMGTRQCRQIKSPYAQVWHNWLAEFVVCIYPIVRLHTQLILLPASCHPWHLRQTREILRLALRRLNWRPSY